MRTSFLFGDEDGISPTDFSGLQWWYAPRLEAYNNDDIVPSLTDRSGNLQHISHGTLRPQYKTNILGLRCVLWDGNDDLLSNFTASPRNDGNFLHEGDFTYIAIINPTSLSDLSYLIDTNDGSATAKGINIRIEATGRITVRMGNGSTIVYNYQTGNNVIVANKWQCLVVRNKADAVDSDLKIYVDNILAGQANPSASYVAGSPSLGYTIHSRRLSGPTESWTGYTSDVLAYNRALTDQELAILLGGLSYS